jgi:competence protein ComEC
MPTDPAAAASAPAPRPLLFDARLPRGIWSSPLAPAALALTAGVLLDRRLVLPLLGSLIAAAVSLLAWLCVRGHAQRGLPLVYLTMSAVAFGSAYHHYRREVMANDDAFHFTSEEPVVAQLQGILDEEPEPHRTPRDDPLRSMERKDQTTAVLWVQRIRLGDDWQTASGRVRIIGVEGWPQLHCGDEVEIVGQFSRPSPPGNPGEFDYADYLRDRGIHTLLEARKTPQAVVRLERGWTTSFHGWLAVLRGYGSRVLRESLPEDLHGLSAALLLGEDSNLTRAEWDKYLRTGIIHVLAISGQHLVILAGFLWFALPRLGVRQRHGAWIVALVVMGYALLAGGRPPALRSAVAVCAVCGALVLRCRALPANLFALSWIAVLLVNPMSIFTTGCLLSFLSVAILVWGARDLFRSPEDPLDSVVDQTRPAWLRAARRFGVRVFQSYALTLLIWLAITPLSASRYNLVSPIGLLLGPPLVVLTTAALFAGFLLLLTGGWCPPLALVAAGLIRASLTVGEWLVNLGDTVPYSHIYTGAVGDWWLWLFYLALLAVLTQEPLRRHWRWAAVSGFGWLCVGLAAGAARIPSDVLRCTFLAVGHGGCTVVETPDGRTLLYDAGSLAGPDVARRQIAPFLWQRGIRRIDEIVFSHADLDHFNGIVDLLDRFAVGQVTYTPTFANKSTKGVDVTLQVLRERAIPIRIAKAGDRLQLGVVAMEVLHPPKNFSRGNENARSLVLRIHHEGHILLLTGDLEGDGLRRVVGELPQIPTDVLQAPHHGSQLTNTTELAEWARPRVVVSCQGRPPPSREVRQCYRRVGAKLLDTGQDGAVIIHSRGGGLVVETFRSKERFVVRDEIRED